MPERFADKRDIQSSFPWYGQDVTARPRPSVFAVLCAILGLASFDLLLWTCSLKSLCRVVRKWPIRQRRHKETPAAIGRICSAVEKGCVWYPKKAVCLQRSAVTTCILRSEGVPARMMIGVRSMPFLAHSWVEVEGSVVNDWPAVKTFYCSLLSQ